MTEAEEDAQLLKSAQSKRRTVRLDKQPGIIGEGYTMHKYQLEGLNWMIKLHDCGINGILADEVSPVATVHYFILHHILTRPPLSFIDGIGKDLSIDFTLSLAS